MPRKNINILLFAGTVLLLAVSAIFAYATFFVQPSPLSADQQISDDFDSLKEELDQLPDREIPVVVGEDFQITLQEFIFYKRNVQLTHKLRNQPFELNNEELLDELIKGKLLVQYAKRLGHAVTDEEVDIVISEQRSMLEDPLVTGQNKEIVTELMKHRIRITGLTADQFWQSEETRQTYEEAILIGKLSMDQKIGTDFATFQHQLLEETKPSLTIRHDLLPLQ